MYPGPHRELLDAHFQTSISASLSAAAEPLEDDDHDDDDDELLEIPSDHNEAVRIWASDSNQGPPVDLRHDNDKRDNSIPDTQSCSVV